MLILTLFRHAKSSWEDRSQADDSRPLNARGRKAAPLMGRYMASAGLMPDRILCSPAVRTRETAALALAQLPGAPGPNFVADLYLAEAGRLLELVRKEKATTRHLMLIGHNPGLHELAISLAGRGPGEDRKRLLEKFPTAGLAVLTFSVSDWKLVREGLGTLSAFMTPRRLEGNATPADDD